MNPGLSVENIRVFLWVGVALLIWLCVQAWQQDYAPRLSGAPDASAETANKPAAPSASANLPALPTAPSATAASATAAPAAAPAVGAAPSASWLSVRTDVLNVRIDLTGGDIREATLPRYPIHKDQPNVPVELLSPEPTRLAVFQTGLRSGENRREANHLARFVAPQAAYQLGADADELVVPLRWDSGNGVTVEKTYTFRRGRYDVGLRYQVRNGAADGYPVASYLQVERLFHSPKRSMFDVESYSFNGPVVFDGRKYAKLDAEKLTEAPFAQSVAKGWLAAIQHHFLVAAVPPAAEQWGYQARFVDNHFIISAMGPLQTVPPGGALQLGSTLFIGPKLQNQLEATADGLELTVDYGVLALLAKPLFWMLEQIYGFVGNWGIAIIIVTLLIKLVFYKLSETSGRSMAGMRKLAPRLKALQERYKDDRQALSQAMMDLYKKEKLNPMAGCLPMLVQIPFFIAFYWVLLESVEMRQAPFALWITDLSAKDPFFVLPLLMGAAMWFQQKLNPAPPDPVQAKVMQVMPVVFTGFFAFFPAGLVLYWLTNSVLSMLQQWRINKVVGAD